MRIVCFGGGTGLPALLSGLKKNPWIEATAVVSMFDSGGSSGVLRDRYGILPPGDILKCLLALAEDEKAARKILLKRISHPSESNHTGGNLLLYALENVYGSYPDAVDALAQILSVRGAVIPVALEPSSLSASYEDGDVARNEVDVDVGIKSGKRIRSVFLDPPVSAYASAIEAIRAADAICIGPGSFYTSVLPNFLPDGVRGVLAQTDVPVVFIVNLLTEGKGMDGMDVGMMTRELERMIGRPVTHVIANSSEPGPELLARYAEEGKVLIADGSEPSVAERLIRAPLWTDPEIARHDSEKLAALIWAVAGRVEKTSLVTNRPHPVDRV